MLRNGSMVTTAKQTKEDTMVHMKDMIIYTDTGRRWCVVDGALYQHGVYGIIGRLAKIDSYVEMEDGSVILRGEHYDVSGADYEVALGVVTGAITGRVSVPGDSF